MLTAGSYPNSNIVVTTQDGASESIPFHCRALGTNKIYFFSASGSDSNSGLTTTSPKRTPGWFRDNAQAGDTAYFRSVGGTYGNDITDSDGGYSDAHMIFYHSPGYFNNGIEGKSITVTSYPGEMAYWLAADKVNHKYVIKTMFGAYIQYWTFSKLMMKAPGACISSSMDGSYLQTRLVGNDFSTSYSTISELYGEGTAINVNGGAASTSYFYALGNYFHDITSDYRGQINDHRAYAIYFGGYGSIDHIYFGYNEIGWNSNGRAFQIYGHTPSDSLSNAYIYNNWFHDVSRQGVILGNGDASPNFIRSLWFYNNVVSNPGSQDVTVLVGGGATDQTLATVHLYNNIFYQNNNYPVLNIYSSPTTYIRNNIIYGNTSPYYTYYSSTSCTRCTGDHNIYYGGSSKPSWDTSTLDNVNPQFISSNPTTYADFFPQSTSPAIDAGTSGVQAVVSRDFLGLPRPQGTSYDIGAYEYSSGQMSCIHESDNNPCNGCISPSELTAYIDRWKFDNQDVTIKDLIDAIGWWKRSGC
jgi:hypothetical protein